MILPKRGVHHLNVLEPTVRVIKTKLVKALKQRSQSILKTSDRYLSRLLDQVTASYNNTSNKHNFTPASVNSEEFDPFLRSVLYPNHKVQPFEDFLAEQLKLQEKLTSPNPKGLETMNETDGSLRVNDLVYVDFKFKNYVQNMAYATKRGSLNRIARIDSTREPYLYILKDLNNQVLSGTYYARELMRGDLKDLQVDRILKKKKGPDGSTLALVCFKNYDS